MAEIQQPYVYMFTVCDKVQCGTETTAVKNILGIHNELFFDEFPTLHPLTFYARFHGGDGIYKGLFEVWWMGPPHDCMGSYDFEVEISKDSWITDKAFKVDMPFEEPGFYEFRISMEGGSYIAHPIYVGGTAPGS